MADDDAAGGASPRPDTEPAPLETGEDAETRAARRELKQSSISDPPQKPSSGDSPTDDSAARPATPAADAPEADQLLSPKKKRAHDQLDQDKPSEVNDANSVASSDSAKDRASRSEPEKKRPRDGEESSPQKQTEQDDQPDTKETKPPQTSASAFATSSFGKLTSGASPFASLGGASASSGFGSLGGPSLSSFASPPPSSASKAPAAAPKLSFGGGSGASPFAGLSKPSNGFGGPISGGSAFGSALGAKPLTSFAAPGGKPFQSEKPAKPFGAPGSDVDDSDDSDDDGEDTPPEEAERAASPEKDSDDKKKSKLHKVAVDDGEAGEATVLSVRAKMFYHDKEAGWKERGAGMLKINVPQSSVEFDDAGVVIPGSFDASALDADEAGQPSVARLILRQDQTHRVILNTAIVPAMKFQEKASLKSVSVLFTAFEGVPAKPVSITMRMTAANSKNFINEIDAIQRELRGN